MSEKTSLIDFPCRFPIKVVGHHSDDFIDAILAITRKHFHDFKDSDIKIKKSSGAKYTSLTLHVYAHNQAELDAIYLELTEHAQTVMVL